MHYATMLRAVHTYTISFTFHQLFLEERVLSSRLNETRSEGRDGTIPPAAYTSIAELPGGMLLSKLYLGFAAVIPLLRDAACHTGDECVFVKVKLFLCLTKSPRYPLDRTLGGPQSRSGQEALYILYIHTMSNM
jgi:hypothetical protein